ncbi:MAG: glyoxylate/hydroxypyruvate reductase A [Pseudomonadota bacterium]
MIRILYAGKEAEFSIYEHEISKGLKKCAIAHEITTDATAPETIDYIVYAPNSAVQDFSPFTKLKLVQSLWAGVETVTGNATLTQPLARMVEHGLTHGMAEYVLGHVMRHHLFSDFYAQRKPGDWRDDVVPPLAEDRTVGILGLGALGFHAATLLSEIGFKTLGWSRSLKQSDRFTCFAGEDGLSVVLQKSDILVLLLPNTPDTHHIISAETLDEMRDGACIINPGRGSLINDTDLLAALDSGKIAGATLDVFETEPLSADHPYWTHQKVLITPHTASSTRPKTAAQTVVENIRRGEMGEAFLHLVNRDLGY